MGSRRQGPPNPSGANSDSVTTSACATNHNTEVVFSHHLDMPSGDLGSQHISLSRHCCRKNDLTLLSTQCHPWRISLAPKIAPHKRNASRDVQQNCQDTSSSAPQPVQVLTTSSTAKLLMICERSGLTFSQRFSFAPVVSVYSLPAE